MNPKGAQTAFGSVPPFISACFQGPLFRRKAPKGRSRFFPAKLRSLTALHSHCNSLPLQAKAPPASFRRLLPPLLPFPSASSASEAPTDSFCSPNTVFSGRKIFLPLLSFQKHSPPAAFCTGDTLRRSLQKRQEHRLLRQNPECDSQALK